MGDVWSDIVSGFVGLAVGVLLGAVLMARLAAPQIDALKLNAIEHGAAQYNPTTGEFEWVTRGTDDK